MLLNFQSEIMETIVGFPIRLVSNCIEAKEKKIGEILAKVHGLYDEGLIFFMLVDSTAKTNLKVGSCVVVHQE